MSMNVIVMKFGGTSVADVNKIKNVSKIVKKNLKKNTKADDGEWKQWVSKLILKTKSPVLPIYFDGQNSQWYHIANKLGLTFRYSLCMYELKRKIGDDIYMYFGSLIKYENLAKIGDIKEITKYLRSTTYSLDPHLKNN